MSDNRESIWYSIVSFLYSMMTHIGAFFVGAAFITLCLAAAFKHDGVRIQGLTKDIYCIRVDKD